MTIEKTSGALRGFARPLLALAAVLGAALLLRLLLRVGCIGSDDVGSWQMATALANGQLAPEQLIQNPIASMRYGLAIPTALFLRLLGNSESVLLIYPIGMSLLGIAAVWDLARRLTGSVRAAHFAGLLMAMTSLDVHYATIFLPDGPMAALGLVAIWCAVVGFEMSVGPPDPGARAATSGVLLALCGLLAALSMMHKISGVQLVGALGLWTLLLMVRRRFRARMWMIPSGFVAGLVAEHALFLAAYGDPLHRWKTIAAASARNARVRQEVATDALSVAARLVDWTGKLIDDWPSFTIVAAAAIVSGCVLLVRRSRDRRLELVGIYLLCILGMRILELTQTYSYQPRRLLPLAGCAAILTACALEAWRARGPVGQRWAVWAGAAFLVLQGALYATQDVAVTKRAAVRLSAERWMFDWVRANAAVVEREGLYVDHRTYKVLYAFSGFDDLRARGVHLYASGDPDSYPMYGERHTRYREGAYFFENPRVLEWLAPYAHGVSWFAIHAELPRTWTLVDLPPSTAGGGCGGALFRIRSTGPGDAEAAARIDPFSDVEAAAAWSPENRLFGGWYVWGTDETPVVTPGAIDGSTGGIHVEYSAGRGPRFSSGGPAHQAPPPKRVSRRNDGLMVRLPIHVDLDSLEQGWAKVRFRLFGYDREGERIDLSRNRGQSRLYFSEQELRAYARAPEDLYGVRLYLQITTPGEYDLATPQVLHHPRLPQGM